MAKICGVPPELKERLKKFRFRKDKTLAAIIMKINKNTLMIEIEEEYEDTSIEELVSELPPQQPRFVALSYPFHHDDGRVSYPLLFIYISSEGCHPELHMMYAGSKNHLVTEGDFTKTVEYQNAEEITEEAIRARLLKF